MVNKTDVQSDTDFLNKLIVGIGEVSEITDIPQRQIRYWEAKGYIKSTIGKTTTRRFDYQTIKKMLLIKELLDEGFTLESAVRKVESRMKMVENALIKLKKRTPR